MMKANLRNFFCWITLLVLVLSSGLSLGEETTPIGIWSTHAFLDEFGMPTDNYYIRSETITGKFSNSATTGSDLIVAVYVQQYKESAMVEFKLIEYGRSVVKNSSSKIKDYDVTMMAPDGEKSTLNGFMMSGASTVSFTTKTDQLILNALNQNGTVRFAIVDSNRSTTKYTFSIEDSSGLDKLMEQMGW